MKESHLYNGYPNKIRDRRIIEIINEYTQDIIDCGAEAHRTSQLSALIQLGQYELEKRQVKRVTRLTMLVSGVSMAIAGIALNIAVENTHASDKWKDEQIILLKEIKTEIVNVGKRSTSNKSTANKSLNRISAKDAPPDQTRR